MDNDKQLRGPTWSLEEREYCRDLYRKSQCKWNRDRGFDSKSKFKGPRHLLTTEEIVTRMDSRFGKQFQYKTVYQNFRNYPEFYNAPLTSDDSQSLEFQSSSAQPVSSSLVPGYIRQPSPPLAPEQDDSSRASQPTRRRPRPPPRSQSTRDSSNNEPGPSQSSSGSATGGHEPSQSSYDPAYAGSATPPQGSRNSSQSRSPLRQYYISRGAEHPDTLPPYGGQ